MPYPYYHFVNEVASFLCLISRMPIGKFASCFTL